MVASLAETCSIAMADMPMASYAIYRLTAAAFCCSLRTQGAAVLTAMGSACNAEALAQIVEAIFVEIAVEASPQVVVHGPRHLASAP